MPAPCRRGVRWCEHAHHRSLFHSLSPSLFLCFYHSLSLPRSLPFHTQASDDVSSLPRRNQHGPSHAKGCDGEHPQQQAPPPHCHALPRLRAAQERLPPPLRKECGVCGSASVTHGVPMCEEDVAANGAQGGWCWLQVLCRNACHVHDESHTRTLVRVRACACSQKQKRPTRADRHRRSQDIDMP